MSIILILCYGLLPAPRDIPIPKGFRARCEARRRTTSARRPEAARANAGLERVGAWGGAREVGWEISIPRYSASSSMASRARDFHAHGDQGDDGSQSARRTLKQPGVWGNKEAEEKRRALRHCRSVLLHMCSTERPRTLGPELDVDTQTLAWAWNFPHADLPSTIT
ncbi:hypothetical protein CSOJ01_15308 [Colletotrichum sojae]|uniref:Uncharacterized protein n=1 Tax=Colletotrichum sojae TaxID=2175907 RepID=A0A8H6MIS5_9PEZI|nr:hypothetical protein CSOJ01_15308 [Colletotrichum sojae]